MADALATSATIARLFSSPTSLSSHPTRFSAKPLSSTHPVSPLSTSLAPKFHPRSLRSSTTISATISVGDKLPESTFSKFYSENLVQTLTVSQLTKGKKAIFFAVPGAFTPTCSQKHLPGFVEKASELKSKGVDVIACIAVNDAFVMRAWRQELGIGHEVLMLSDGNGDFTRAIGAELDLSDKPFGFGIRSRRYALLADDGVVKVLNLEEGGDFTFSGAEDMLKAL